VNDRHLSGNHYPTGTADDVGHPSYGYPGQHTEYGHDPYGQAAQATAGYAQQPYAQPGYGQQDPYGQAAAYDSGQYDTTSWDSTPAHGTPRFEPEHFPSQQTGEWDSGAYPAAGHDTGQHAVYDTATHSAGGTHGGDAWGTGGQPTADWDTGGWDARAWDTGQQQAADWDSGAYPTVGIIPPQPGPTEWETMAGQPAADWDSGAYPAAQPAQPAQHFETAERFETAEHLEPVEHFETAEFHPAAPEEPAAGYAGYDEDADVVPPSASRPRGRRRPKARRSALLTVAAPSLCVLGVTAMAANAITQPDDSSQSEDDQPLAASDEDPSQVKALAANEPFDTQLEGLTAAADDYADRASRTQGRMDLEQKKADEKKQAEQEAARKEAARQKFFMPVEQRGLSAVYGQAGINWMSSHTGIDFPVRYGTPVRAATDGTIRTQWHFSYGNLMVITAPDGTETWYAHLSSTVYQSGYVQAGTVVAYSGNSGKSTGPHLHFEVRPGGGSTVDPSQWLRDKGLSAT
jgi:murein DD-endopeptidase MepM/ murein hydrolase activator NlpD